MNDRPFKIIRPHAAIKKHPILVSIPHSGTLIPEKIAKGMHRDITRLPEDTDWLVDEIYNFCPSLGITTISANFSRYVVDLNRPTNSTNLYVDGRKETNVIPVSTFSGAEIYKHPLTKEHELEERLPKYYHPYYNTILID